MDKPDKDSVASLVLKRYQTSRDYVKPYFDRFLDNYKHYFLRTIDEAVEADPDNYPLYSQIMLPITYQVVETILPRMFLRMPTFTLNTEDPNDEADEHALTELIRYQMKHPYLIDDPIFYRLAGGLKETFITGNSWGEVPWYKKEVEVDEWLPYSPEMGIPPSRDALPIIQQYGIEPRWILTKVKKRVIDSPVYEQRSVFHVFPRPGKRRVSDLGWLISEEYMDMRQLMTMINADPGKYQRIDEVKQLAPWQASGETQDMTYDSEMANLFGADDYTLKDTGHEDDKQFKVWFLKEEEKLTIVVNEAITIRESENPNGDGKIGMFLMKDIPNPHELYAWGEPDPIKKIEDGMSDQFNMRNDNVFYDLLRMWKLDPTALIDGEEFYPAPGSVVQMNDLDGLQPIETGNTKASAYREYDEWEQIIQGTSGVTDYATGGGDLTNDTKGGIELLQQAANNRFAFKLQLFEQLGLTAMGNMYVQRNLRFFDMAQRVPTETGKMLITPEQIHRISGQVYFAVDAGSSSSTSQATEIQKWDKAADILERNVPNIIKSKALNAIGVRETDQIMQELAQQQAAQAAAAAAAQANPVGGGINGIEPNAPTVSENPGGTATI